ncbi:MAG: hypothetical protein RLZZ435_392 [Cyanobacteriota bacterium]
MKTIEIRFTIKISLIAVVKRFWINRYNDPVKTLHHSLLASQERINYHKKVKRLQQ